MQLSGTRLGPIGILLACVVSGLAGGVVTSLANTAVIAQADRPVVVQQPASPGRYQIVMSPHMARDTYLLDAQTGKTWKRVSYSDLENDPVVWEFQDRVDTPTELQAWWSRHTPKTEKK